MRRAERIAVDLTYLLPSGENGGAGSIVLDLLGHFTAADREVLLLVQPRGEELVDHLVGPGVTRYVVRPLAEGGRRSPTEHTSWPPPWSLPRAIGADVLYCPFGDPLWSEHGVPTVSALYDLQHLDHPEHFGAHELAYREDFLGRMVALADRIVVATEWAKASMVRHLEIEPAAVEVVPLAGRLLDVGVGPVEADGKLPWPYVLYPANAWLHKNHERLYAALATVLDRRAANGGSPLGLVCTGAEIGRAGELGRLAAELGIEDHVRHLGFVDDAELDSLYRGAEALVFPSRYEGFGMPVLEAMARGVPVACSDVAALPEVVDDAALLFDPLDTDAIAAAIERVVTDAALRAELGARAKARVDTFALQRTADGYLRVFDDVVREHSASRTPPHDPAPPHPTVSVVMPSYQHAAFIERSIRSVLDQEEPPIEFTIVDGGSTDGTVELLERHAGQLAFVSEPDRGQAHAVNKGVARSTGDIIGWLNSDDIWYPDALAVAADVLGRHPDLGFVYFAADYLDPDDAVLEPYDGRPWDPVVFEDSCFICQPAAFVRRDRLAAVGGLDESLQLCMDYELWLRLARLGPPVYVPIVVAGSRLHPETKTVGQRPAVTTEIVTMLRRTLGRVPDWWMLVWACAQVDAERAWDRDDPVQDRTYHRRAFTTAVRGYVRFRTKPSPGAISTLRTWADGGWSRAAGPARVPMTAKVGASLPGPVRRSVSRPYHRATRWIRRRTLWELEPRLAAIEHQLAALAARLEQGEGDTAVAELHRILHAHQSVEEALVDRMTDEVAELRRLLDGRADGGDDGS